MSATYAARKAAAYDRLDELEKLVVDRRGGVLGDWELREQIMQTLERLPKSEMAAWLDGHRHAREFIEAQPPPTQGT